MEQESRIHVFERQFGYCNVLWEVENYFSATCANNWIIYSPEFSVTGSQVTKWRLFLKGKHILGHYTVHTYLERLENDPCPCAVQVHWRMSYPYDKLEHVAPEVSRVFEKKAAFETGVGNIVLIESKLRLASHQTFTVRCRLLVYNKDPVKFDISNDVGLKGLFQDMTRLFKSFEGWDITLFVGQNIFAHKAILCIRNRILKCVIENEGKSVNMDFVWVKPKAAEGLIAFLYTGNLNYVLRSPCLAVHDLINYLNVTELKSYYAEDEVTVRTSFGMQEFNFKWTISNISSHEDCILSPCWRTGMLNTAFQLTLYLKRFDEEGEHMDIYGEFVMDKGPNEVFLECAVLDVNKRPQGLKFLRWTREEIKRLGFAKFITKDNLEDPTFVTNGKLEIICKLQIPTGTQTQSVINTKTYTLVDTKKNSHFEKLSEDLGKLFETGEYSDFTVTSRILRYRIHKAILMCRSNVLNKILVDTKDRTQISLEDIDPYALRIVLKYMYTGTLKNINTETVLKIYPLAVRFYILPLKRTCSQILRDGINLGNVFDIVSLANDSKDFKLKASAFTFISDNVIEIQQLESWINFVKANVSLSKELAAFIKTYITVHNRERLAQSGYSSVDDFIKHYMPSNNSS